MAERQQALAAAILKDPDVDSLSSFIGVDGTNTTLNSGRFLINLKPHGRAQRDAPARSSAACSSETATVAGITLYMQPVQDLTIDATVSRTQYQFVLEDADPAELATVGAEAGRPADARCRELADVASDLQDSGLPAYVDDRPRHRRALRHHRRRPSTTRSTTPSASASSRPSSPSPTSTA